MKKKKEKKFTILKDEKDWNAVGSFTSIGSEKKCLIYH